MGEEPSKIESDLAAPAERENHGPGRKRNSGGVVREA